MEPFFAFLCGALQIRIQGFGQERFLNLCALKGIKLWDLTFEEGIICKLSLSDFYELHPMIKKTKVKVVIQKRIGLPFLMPIVKRKWIFMTCLTLTVLLLFVSSRFLWKIQFEGNMEFTRDQFMDFLQERGIRIGVPIRKIDENMLEKELRKAFPNLVWVNFRLDGTQMTVSVKENELRDASLINEPQNQNGRSLFAQVEGRVVRVLAQSGIPVVKPGMEVTKGQLLIDGNVPIRNEDGTIRSYMPVFAKGIVIIETKKHFEAVQSVFHEEVELTGRSRRAWRICLGDQNLSFFGKKEFFREYFTEEDITPLFMKRMPNAVIFLQGKHLECRKVLKKYDEEEVKALLEKKLLRFLATLEEKGVQIIEKNVKIDIEGNFGIIYGEILTWEEADLYQSNLENNKMSDKEEYDGRE